MSASGRLVLTCKATGEKLPLEDLRWHGYDFTIVGAVTVTPYFVPFKRSEQPPVCPAGLSPVERAAFYDEVIGKAISDCLAEKQAG